MSDVFATHIGTRESALPADRLPTGRDVLRNLYFHTSKKDKKVPECARIVGSAVRKLWVVDNDMKTTHINNIVKKIMKLHRDFEYLRKAQHIKEGGAYSARESAFSKEMGSVFDVASTGTPLSPSMAEKRQAAVAAPRMSDLVRLRKRKSVKPKTETAECEPGPSSRSGKVSDPDFVPDEADDDETATAGRTYKLPGRPGSRSRSMLFGYLDRGNSTSRNAFRTVASVAVSMSEDDAVDLHKLKCSKTTIYRQRIKERAQRAAAIRRLFRNERGDVRRLTVHFDGIHVLPLEPGSRRKLVERLPTVVTGQGVDQLLAGRIIPSGSGEHVAAEVLKCLQDWECADDVVAICTDTTGSNTGYEIGAATRIERALDREVLYLACRHHVLEVIPKHLFDRLIETSKSPDLGTLCKNLQEKWNTMDHTSFKSAMDDPQCAAFLADRRAQILEFAEQALQKPHTRADYRYLLELVVIFLGGNPKPDQPIQFSPPIAVSSARFMARIIYCLTIHMFALTGEYEIDAKILNNLRELNLFFVCTYLKPWYTSTVPTIAPRTDLQFAKDIIGYTKCKKISDIAGSVFRNHLWYLHGVTVGLAFFDEGIPLPVKREMVARLSAPPPKSVSPWKRHVLPKNSSLKSLRNKEIPDFISKTTAKFFDIMKLDTSFLAEDPEGWPNNPVYQANLQVIQAIQVVNDVAERGVALVKRFSKEAITKKEDSFQDLLVVQSQILKDEKHSEANLTLAHYMAKNEPTTE